MITNKIINCIKYEEQLNKNIYSYVEKLKNVYNIKPTLTTILIGSNQASALYVKNKTIKAEKLNIKVYNINLPKICSETLLLQIINYLNTDIIEEKQELALIIKKLVNKEINNISENLNNFLLDISKNHIFTNGILVQMPLPKHINSIVISNAINPLKDVDGLSSNNLGLLMQKEVTGLIPCTPLGILYVIEQELEKTNCKLEDKNVVIVGRSNLVGLPTFGLLLAKNATITITHSYTKNLANVCKNADILITAIGKPEFINENYVKENSIIIDVGINKITQNNKTIIKGDVDFNKVINKVAKITPVPKGIGRLTTTFLMFNTFKATILQNNLKINDFFKHL